MIISVGTGSAEDVSGGEVAGIVLSILIISAIVAAGTLVGGLMWKYQPWERSNDVVKKNSDRGEYVAVVTSGIDRESIKV